MDLTAPSSPGTYYYGACVDAVTDESDTTNNCSASVQVTVSEPQDQPQGLPDLTISAVAVTTNPSGTYPGESFTLSATVRNDGDGASGVTTLRYYRSTDGTITTSDIEVGSYAVAELSTSGAPASQSILQRFKSRDIPLWSVRGYGDRRVRHQQQLLGIGAGGCRLTINFTTAAAAATGPSGRRFLPGKRRPRRRSRPLSHFSGQDTQCWQRGVARDDATFL